MQSKPAARRSLSRAQEFKVLGYLQRHRSMLTEKLTKKQVLDNIYGDTGISVSPGSLVNILKDAGLKFRFSMPKRSGDTVSSTRRDQILANAVLYIARELDVKFQFDTINKLTNMAAVSSDTYARDGIIAKSIIQVADSLELDLKNLNELKGIIGRNPTKINEQ